MTRSARNLPRSDTHPQTHPHGGLGGKRPSSYKNPKKFTLRDPSMPDDLGDRKRGALGAVHGNSGWRVQLRNEIHLARPGLQLKAWIGSTGPATDHLSGNMSRWSYILQFV